MPSSSPRFGPLPKRYQDFAEIMHTSAQHLLQLINDILDLAKVESGKHRLGVRSVPGAGSTFFATLPRHVTADAADIAAPAAGEMR